jgi:hypothetical protein
MEIEIEKLKSKLGRLHIPDERDKKFQIKSLLPSKTPGITYKYHWSNGWWGDQADRPECVAYAWDHWLVEGSITQHSKRSGGGPPIDVHYLYHEVQNDISLINLVL